MSKSVPPSASILDPRYKKSSTYSIASSSILKVSVLVHAKILSTKIVEKFVARCSNTSNFQKTSNKNLLINVYFNNVIKFTKYSYFKAKFSIIII
jgi:hypothetical protein